MERGQAELKIESLHGKQGGILAVQGLWLLFVSRGEGLWGTGREVENRHVDGGMTGERGYVAEKLHI